MSKVYLSFIFVLLIFQVAQSQTHFTPLKNAGDAMNINVIEAKVNGINLEAGDEIGIFDGDLCVGAEVLTESLLELFDNKVLYPAAYADDPDVSGKDGFIVGNEITFKMYDSSEDEEIPLVVSDFYNPVTGTIITSSPTFEIGGSAFVSLSATHNYTPKSNAGADQILNENAQGQLDGSASSDFEGSQLSYTWTDIDNLGLSATNVVNPEFTAPLVTQDTDYQVKLVVNDGEKDSKPDTVVITVKNVPLAPVANAGSDQTVDEDVLVTLDGSASSDPDDAPSAITYQWTSLDGITLNNPTTVSPTFTSPILLADASYRFQLVVYDGNQYSDPDVVVITVDHANLIPVADAGDPQTVDEDVLVTLDGSASSDPDDGPSSLTYQWTSLDGITLTNPTTVSPTFTSPNLLADGSYRFDLVVYDGDKYSTSDRVVISVDHENIAPVADAGDPQTVDEGVLVTLDGSASSDADSAPNALTYQWTSLDGITLTNPTSATPTFTSPNLLADGSYRFDLVVYDGDKYSTSDRVVISVDHENIAPVADAGDPQTVDEDVLVTLDGSASSDPDDGPSSLTYQWTSLDGITITNPTAASPTFTSPNLLTDGSYRFQLVVYDGNQYSDPDVVVITVDHANLIPVADAGDPQTVDEDVLVTLDGSASSDPDDGPSSLTYQWTSLDGITLTNPTTATPTFTSPNLLADGSYRFDLVVYDGDKYSASDRVVISVDHENIAPVADAGDPQTVDEGVLVTLDGSASSDADSAPNALTYQWTSLDGITLTNPTSATPTFTSPNLLADGSYRFDLVVYDGDKYSTSDRVVISVDHENIAPVADAGDPQTVDENVQGQLDGTASSDPEGLTLTYNWSSPEGFTIENPGSATPTFTAPEVQVDTDFEITLTVTDQEQATDIDAVTVTVKHINKAPVADAGSDQDVDEGVLVTLDGSASYDLDQNDNITYQWTSLDGITLTNPTTASPTFTSPDLLADASYRFELVVYDGVLFSDPDIIVVTVIHDNLAPTADAGTAITINENEQVQLDGSGSSDPESQQLTYSWVVPEGFSIDDQTSASPTIIAPEVQLDTDFDISLTVDDGVRTSNPDIVVVTVKQVPQKPIAVAGQDQTVDENVLVTLDGSGSYDVDINDVLTYQWTSLDGITLTNPATVSPTFTSPYLLADGSYRFELVVCDGDLYSDPDIIVVSVDHENLAPVANAGDPQIVDEGVLVTLDGSASYDADSAPNALTYQWTSLDGITLTNPTTASPTFTSPNLLADGSYRFDLVVYDGDKYSTSDRVVISVDHANLAPVANAGSDQTVDEDVLVTLDGSASSDADAMPNALTYQWTSLDGITLTNPTTVSPTFTSPILMADGSYRFELVVYDGALYSDPDIIVVSVDHANLQPTANAGDDQTIDENTQGQLDGSGSSDPEGQTLSYSWTAPEGFVIDTPTSVGSTFTAPEVHEDTDFEIVLMVDDGADDNNTNQNSVIVTVKHYNKAPVADAGNDFSVREQESVSLNGTASSDPDLLDNITYSWTAPDGIVLDDNTSSTPQFTSPAADQDTQLTFSLTVKDDALEESTDQVIVTVTPNRRPSADAGNSATYNSGEEVTLDGRGSRDSDGDRLSYYWTTNDDVTLSGNRTSRPSFIAPEVDGESTFTFTLRVTDDLGASDTDQVTITVIGNSRPIAVAGDDVIVNEGEEFTLDGTASYDPEGDDITYLWSMDDQSEAITTAIFTGIAPEVEKDTTLAVILVVNDGIWDSENDTVFATVKQVNKSPEFISDPVLTADAGYEYTYTVEVSDPDLLDTITISAVEIPEWLSLVDNGDGTATLSGTPEKDGALLGDHSVILTATDANIDEPISQEFTIAVDWATGIDDVVINTTTIYPNPTEGIVTIESANLPVGGMTVSVYSQSGQLVLQKIMTSQNTQLDLSGNTPGVYFIRIVYEDSIYSEKLILK